MKKVYYILIALLPIQWIAIGMIKKNPEWIELFFSQNLYPFIFKMHRFFLVNLPFSFGDLFYGIIVIFIIMSIIQLIKKPKQRIKLFLIQSIAILSLILIVFQITWGLNYYRIPLHKSLNYNLKYNEAELTETLEKLIKTTNILHLRLSNSDSISVQIPYSKDVLINMIEKNFSFEEELYPIKPFVKNSQWSTLLSYMGYAGYLNPLTLESQVNKHIPKLNYITTVAHEMAHQLGVAPESEANYIAFYTTINHPNPFIQYSGYSFAIRYCYSELYKANPEKAKELISVLHPGIIEKFKELSAFWREYKNPFEPFLKKGYDSYLKANGQRLGIKSYDAMVALVIAHSQVSTYDLDKFY
ncbi:DUF3810 domain-containing protein [Flavobacteriaceae bacterium]|nr:DUF3810 domain-containing protein [Flavobacteriaceae bacterium]MDB4612415.1 DUF3810 domain-containing protein [Flavobacteriaceae bacterium]